MIKSVNFIIKNIRNQIFFSIFVHIIKINMIQFPNTIEVFNKIATKVHSNDGVITEYIVTDKQMDWLMRVYYKELPKEMRNGESVSVVSVAEGDQWYSFGYTKKIWNVPHYIPNRASYGSKYIISKYKNK